MLDVGGHTVVILTLVYIAIERSEAMRMITMGLLSAQILITGISSSTESPRSQNRFFGVWGLTSPAYPDTRLSGLYGVDRAHIAPLSSIFKNNGRFDISCNGSHVWINIEIGDVISSGEDQAAVRADLNGVLLTAAPQDKKSTSDVRAFVEKDLIKAPVRRDLLDMLTVSDPVTLVIASPSKTATYIIETAGAGDAIAAFERSCGYIHDV